MKAHVMSWLVTHLDGEVEEGTGAEEEEVLETTAVTVMHLAERLLISQLLGAPQNSWSWQASAKTIESH